MVNKKVTPTTPTPSSANVPQRKARPATAERATVPRGAASVKTAPSQRTVPPKPSAAASRFEGVQRGVRETVAELKKVQWPDRLTTRNLTLVVIGMSAALAVILGLLDAGLTRAIEWLVRLPLGG
jgi:preprotein translocase subunit SecE